MGGIKTGVRSWSGGGGEERESCCIDEQYDENRDMFVECNSKVYTFNLYKHAKVIMTVCMHA